MPADSLTYGSRTFIVPRMERNRIARVKIVTARPAEATEPELSGLRTSSGHTGVL